MSTAKERLMEKVLQHSVSNTWDKASKEWFVTDMFVDESGESTCICGHKHLKDVYIICNSFTAEELYPIGSECIKRFNNEAMNDEAEDCRLWGLFTHQLLSGTRINVSKLDFSIVNYLKEMEYISDDEYDILFRTSLGTNRNSNEKAEADRIINDKVRKKLNDDRRRDISHYKENICS
ncbi:MAG: hypothetical protein ACI4CS_00500 [Candidatus Weimeria sp.]